MQAHTHRCVHTCMHTHFASEDSKLFSVPSVFRKDALEAFHYVLVLWFLYCHRTTCPYHSWLRSPAAGQRGLLPVRDLQHMVSGQVIIKRVLED